jgi:hypothetical protein
MTLQSVVEAMLVAGAILLLLRDLRRARRDRQRRPITLLAAGLVAALLIGAVAGRAHPSPWWLAIPAAVLLWEVGRGWRVTPRCRLWELGVAAFAVSLLLAMAGLGLAASALLAASAAACAAAVGLLWLSHLREPHPWRAGDTSHYERRSAPRP